MRRLSRNVVALGAVSLFTDFSSEMIAPLLPVFLVGTLGATATMVGLIEGAAESVSGVLKFLSGWWSDRVARRKPLVVAGYLLASLARPLVGVAQTASQLFAIRMVDRVGKGVRGAPRDAMIADSSSAADRGLAYGFHRGADHLGAVAGPLAAFALLTFAAVELRTVFLLAALPAAVAVVVLLTFVREGARSRTPKRDTTLSRSLQGLGPRFWRVMGVIFLFTLGCSTDAFILLRASDLGVPLAQLPLLWVVLHVVKSLSSVPGGILSDRFGRRGVLTVGWVTYAAVYFALALAQSPWHIWVLLAIYGLHFGLVEGPERALVADLVDESRRGSAFGAYNLALSAGALPASVIFGVVWDSFGAAAAFTMGGAVALASTVLLWVVVGASGSRSTPPAPS